MRWKLQNRDGLAQLPLHLARYSIRSRAGYTGS